MSEEAKKDEAKPDETKKDGPKPDDAKRAILLAEYAAIRGEITTFLSLQGQFLNFAAAFAGVCVALLVKPIIAEAMTAQTIQKIAKAVIVQAGQTIGDQELQKIVASEMSKAAQNGPDATTLNFFGIPFIIFALLYADAGARIMRAATFLHLTIRSELEPILGPTPEEKYLSWENHVREHAGYIPLKILEYFRWIIFLGPAILLACKAATLDSYVLVAPIILTLLILIWVFEVLSRKVIKPATKNDKCASVS